MTSDLLMPMGSPPAATYQASLFTADNGTPGTMSKSGPCLPFSPWVLVYECLHISELLEHADDFDIIHNNFDFLPLTYSRLTHTPFVSTIHGFSSPAIMPVFAKYNRTTSYVSISNADRSPDLEYLATVYHGIDLKQFDFVEKPQDYLVFFGRIHPDKGAGDAIEIARASGKKLILAGIVQDTGYYERFVRPFVDGDKVEYRGSVGPRERNELLGNAIALLHPIHFNEPFGLSVMESMACGTPVIAFSRGSMPELIVHGENGYLVATVQEATAAVGHLQNIGRRNCRKHVECHFTADRMVDAYCKVYSAILENGF